MCQKLGVVRNSSREFRKIVLATVIGIVGLASGHSAIAATPDATGVQLKAAGDKAYDAEDYRRSAEYYRAAIALGNHEAEYSLGVQYQMGAGVAHNPAVAIKLFTAAANAGVAAAMARAAYMYLGDNGIPQNYAMARQWAEGAAQKGYGKGSGLLGAMYDDGTGVPQNKCTALHWYKMADEQGFDGYDDFQGKIYAAGQCGEANWPLARHYFEKAAKNGSRLAIVSLQILDRLDRENRSQAYKAAMMAGMKAFVDTMASPSANGGEQSDSTRFNMWVENNRNQGLNDNGTPK